MIVGLWHAVAPCEAEGPWSQPESYQTVLSPRAALVRLRPITRWVRCKRSQERARLPARQTARSSVEALAVRIAMSLPQPPGDGAAKSPGPAAGAETVAASSGPQAKKQPPPEKPSDVRRRSRIILSFWLIVLCLGLPIWWQTTSIYRADLPLQEMLEWADGKVCTADSTLFVVVCLSGLVC